MDTQQEHRARALDMTYRDRAAAFSPRVRLTASEATWLARREREPVSEQDVRECMGSPDSDGLFVDSEVVATNGMSVSVTLPSEQEDEQVKRAGIPVPCTYTHGDGMHDDGTVWGWTDLQGRYVTASHGPARKPRSEVSAAALRMRRMRDRKRTERAKREPVSEPVAPVLDFDAVMRAMASNAASGTGLERE